MSKEKDLNLDQPLTQKDVQFFFDEYAYKPPRWSDPWRLALLVVFFAAMCAAIYFTQ